LLRYRNSAPRGRFVPLTRPSGRRNSANAALRRDSALPTLRHPTPGMELA